MRDLRRARRSGFGLCWSISSMLLAIATASGAAADGEGVELVAMVSADNSVASLSLTDVQDIYRARKTYWSPGVPIRIILPELGTPDMDALASRVFGMRSRNAVRRFYLNALFKLAITEMPDSMDSDAAHALVQRDKFAIALVPRSQAQQASRVRYVTIEGW